MTKEFILRNTKTKQVKIVKAEKDVWITQKTIYLNLDGEEKMLRLKTDEWEFLDKIPLWTRIKLWLGLVK